MTGSGFSTSEQAFALVTDAIDNEFVNSIELVRQTVGRLSSDEVYELLGALITVSAYGIHVASRSTGISAHDLLADVLLTSERPG